ncbi:MAG: glucose-1-phosphate cytidylyltransferase [Candidatus Omnitrophota bacterium]|nr:glucose-1-phosphate cytidylyltransferase [Candidatus Omnitrophota bacterium]
MKIVILAGGRGTRISEETEVIPKPMVEIGGKPILWHIMKIYSHYGFNEFIICLGYKGYLIKEYFSHYFLHMSDVTIDMSNNKVDIHSSSTEPWKVTLIDTGIETKTGGRLKRIEKYVEKQPFFMTYGDGVGNIDIIRLLEFHKKNKVAVTVTAAQPTGRFGSLNVDKNDKVISFQEKPKGDKSWVNAGFFVLEPIIFKYIEGDDIFWEKEPMEKLAESSQIMSYKHNDFWRPMDTLRDKMELEQLWQSHQAPWRVWSKNG